MHNATPTPTSSGQAFGSTEDGRHRPGTDGHRRRSWPSRCVATLIGAVIVQRSSSSPTPSSQANAVEIYANRALRGRPERLLDRRQRQPEPGPVQHRHQQHPALCSGIDYGQWNLVNGSDAPGADPSTTPSAIPSRPSTRRPMRSTNLSVAGGGRRQRSQLPPTTTSSTRQTDRPSRPATASSTTSGGRTTSPTARTGNYSTCNYNWKLNYNINEPERRLWPGLLRPQRLPLRAGVHQRLGVRERRTATVSTPRRSATSDTSARSDRSPPPTRTACSSTTPTG